MRHARVLLVEAPPRRRRLRDPALLPTPPARRLLCVAGAAGAQHAFPRAQTDHHHHQRDSRGRLSSTTTARIVGPVVAVQRHGGSRRLRRAQGLRRLGRQRRPVAPMVCAAALPATGGRQRQERRRQVRQQWSLHGGRALRDEPGLRGGAARRARLFAAVDRSVYARALPRTRRDPLHSRVSLWQISWLRHLLLLTTSGLLPARDPLCCAGSSSAPPRG